MPPNSITNWLDFATQQVAAESYLQGIDWNDPQQVQRQLQLGNNNLEGATPNDPLLPGKTRLTALQAEQFTQRYHIVDHHANDASGFSATLFSYVEDGITKYTLSFRSLEYRNQGNGGDWERDGLLGASGEIPFRGFAFAQLAAMEEYWSDLTQGRLSNGTIDPTLQAFFQNPANKINATGYSLGGHLATVFTELHTDRVDHTYIYNGAGRGYITGIIGQPDPPDPLDGGPIQAMLARLTEVLFNPEAEPEPPDGDDFRDIFIQAKALHDADPSWNPFSSGNTANLYQDPRYQWALHATALTYATIGTAFIPRTDETGGAFDKITQLFGGAGVLIFFVGAAHITSLHWRERVGVRGKPRMTSWTAWPQ
jgi:pimeloyl-ACP methyl ester carboxylesterase